MKKLLSTVIVSLSLVSTFAFAQHAVMPQNLKDIDDQACSSDKHNGFSDFCSCFKQQVYDNCQAANRGLSCKGIPYGSLIKADGMEIKSFHGVSTFCNTFVKQHLPNIHTPDCIADNKIMFSDSGGYIGSCPIS